MPRRKRTGRAVKKNRTHNEQINNDEVAKAPHSFVIHKGKTGKTVQELTADFRKVMEPYTASNIKNRPQNVMKDYVSLAGVLNVSHMVTFTRTEKGPYVKFARFPKGPTLTFKVHNYTLSRDVKSSLKRQITYDQQFMNHPLLILNGFAGSDQKREVSLMTSMFQNMFPSLNVTTVNLNSIRRCVLLNFDPETGQVEFRHYTIKIVPVGMTKPVKKILQGKVPNLSRFESMAEYLAGGGAASESEGEDDETSHVTVPQSLASRGNLVSQKSSVRLVELGPRISMELIKIEEGLHDGQVLYHKYVSKTDEEKKEIKRILEKRKKEKLQRKQEQEKNVKKKADAKEAHKQKSLSGMLKKVDKNDLPAAFQGETAEASSCSSSDDDDEEYFKEEVGQKPDKDLFDGSQKKRKRKASSGLDSTVRKRMKKSADFGKKGPKFKAKKGPVSDKGRGGDKKGKRPTRVFNSQGIGPNFSKKKGSAPPVASKFKNRKNRK